VSKRPLLVRQRQIRIQQVKIDPRAAGVFESLFGSGHGKKVMSAARPPQEPK